LVPNGWNFNNLWEIRAGLETALKQRVYGGGIGGVPGVFSRDAPPGKIFCQIFGEGQICPSLGGETEEPPMHTGRAKEKRVNHR